MTTTETPVFEALDGTCNDVHAIATLGALAHGAEPLKDGQIYAVKDGDQMVLLETPGYTDDREDHRAPSPRRVERSVTVRDAASLVDYLNENTTGPDDPARVGDMFRHGVGDLELWADIDRRTIRAIVDGGNGWRKHTATLELRHSIEWAEWTSIDGKLVDQLAFAQFIEDHLSSIGAPDGAKLLEICQTLEARTKVDFKSSELLANGQRKFRYDETTEAKAGQKGDLTIPAELTLVLRPFQGSEPVAILARFRYRLDGGQLRLGVKLAEPSKALEVAFNQIVDEVQASVPVRVNHGVG